MTTETKHAELRECGTCGSPHKPQLHDEAVDYKNIRQVYYWCSSCGAMSCASRYDPLIQSGKQIAIEKSHDNWNARASDARIAELEAENARLREALEKYGSAKFWHWDAYHAAWHWNGPDSAYFKGCKTASDLEYPPQEIVSVECGAIARAALGEQQP